MVGEESIFSVSHNTPNLKVVQNVINQRTFIVRNLSEIIGNSMPDHKQLPMPGLHLSSVPDWKGQSRV